MGERIRLGFVYLWDEKWLGGVYYANNLLNALNTIDDKRKPIVVVHCLDDKSFLFLQNQTQYPYLEKYIVRISAFKSWYRKFLRVFSIVASSKVDLFNISKNVDAIFPWGCGSQTDKLIMWIPDFQEKHFPEFFSKRGIAGRDYILRAACRRHVPIVFSSNDSKRDFNSYYPEYADNKVFVVHFAVTHPDFSDIDIAVIKKKYGIDKNYLLCANQFWKHKNHLFLFKAFNEALKNGLDLQLVCTGNMMDYRDPNYIEVLKNFITSNHLERKVLTLGMIDKNELYCLMKHSYSVIQPSLFEGWNTTVEDCKAMSKFIFLSDLPVHREQIDRNVCFFDPHNEEDLANKLLTISPQEVYYDYNDSVRQFGEDFCDMLRSRIDCK